MTEHLFPPTPPPWYCSAAKRERESCARTVSLAKRLRKHIIETTTAALMRCLALSPVACTVSLFFSPWDALFSSSGTLRPAPNSTLCVKSPLQLGAFRSMAVHTVAELTGGAGLPPLLRWGEVHYWAVMYFEGKKSRRCVLQGVLFCRAFTERKKPPILLTKSHLHDQGHSICSAYRRPPRFNPHVGLGETPYLKGCWSQ